MESHPSTLLTLLRETATTDNPMKTHKKNGQRIYLAKSNKRWKWMAAATAAGVTASQASLVTINLINNYIGSDGNYLDADLTGDGHPDLTIANAFARHSIVHTFSTGLVVINYFAGANINGVFAYARRYGDGYGSFVVLGSNSKAGYPGNEPTLTGSIPIFFKDLHINGGAPTEGSLEVTVGPLQIQLDSFTYTTPGQGSRSLAVPDHGSTLALLAMGAGGVLALRRWRAAQARSQSV
jgi:hypothetical protein